MLLGAPRPASLLLHMCIRSRFSVVWSAPLSLRSFNVGRDNGHVGTLSWAKRRLALRPPSSSSGARSALARCSRSLRPSSEGERESLASLECQPYPDQSTRTVKLCSKIFKNFPNFGLFWTFPKGHHSASHGLYMA